MGFGGLALRGLGFGILGVEALRGLGFRGFGRDLGVYGLGFWVLQV